MLIGFGDPLIKCKSPDLPVEKYSLDNKNWKIIATTNNWEQYPLLHLLASTVLLLMLHERR